MHTNTGTGKYKDTTKYREQMCEFFMDYEGAFDVVHSTVCELVATFIQHVDDNSKVTH